MQLETNIRKKDMFRTYHPIINLLFFAIVLGFAMILNHPLTQLISCISAIWYAVQCEGKQAVVFSAKACIPMIALTVFINPAFNHGGVTILLYFPTGNPLTLESILYGFSAGVLLATVVMWFVNFNRVMTSDKIIYLFGRIIPAMSLIISMTLRLIPKLKMQMNHVIEAQRCIGRDISYGSIWNRTKTAITIISILITWSLEDAIETADSMKSRGFGLRGRTAFSIYRFDERDRSALIWFGFCGFYILMGTVALVFGFRYLPSIRSAGINGRTIWFYIVYLLLCMSPVIINSLEDKKWKSMDSKM